MFFINHGCPKEITMHQALVSIDLTFKKKQQTALFKDPVRTAQ
jgi:hypothetical protein